MKKHYVLIPGVFIMNSVVGSAQSGNLDVSFGIGGTTIHNVTSDAERINAITLKDDDGILAVGTGGDQAGLIIASYNIDGFVDSTFGTNGSVITNFGLTQCWGADVAVDAQGRIVVTGWATVSGLITGVLVARFLPDGVLDNTFSDDGWLVTGFVEGSARGYGVVIQSDGKIVVCGNAGDMTLLVRYSDAGLLDPAFGNAGRAMIDITGSSETAYALTLQPDGKIIVAGDGYEPTVLDQVGTHARINTDGSLEYGMSGTGIRISRDISLAEDGSYFITGSNVSGSSPFVAVAKFLSDGMPDTAFGSNGYYSPVYGGRAESSIMQADGKLIVAGWRGSLNYDFAMFRFLADQSGSDPAFGNGNGLATIPIGSSDDLAYDMAIQSSGKVIIAGSANVSGSNRFALARVHAMLPCDLFPEPDGVEVTHIDNDIQIVWEADEDGPFTIRYREQGTNDWIELTDNLTDTFHLASGLSPCIAYEFQVGVNCTGDEMNYSESALLGPIQQVAPVIMASGPTTICEGDSIVISSSYVENNLWNTGDTGQSIIVAEAGIYELTVSGLCEELFADPVEITSLDPALPQTETFVIFNGPGSTILTATGDSILWYDQPVGGDTVGSGSTWETPFLDASTSFWVANVLVDSSVVCESERVEIVIDITLSIMTYSNDQFLIHPNPAHDRIFVVAPIEWNPEKELYFEIHDVGGRSLLKRSMTKDGSMIPIMDLANGTYVFRILQIDHIVTTGKLVVLR